MARYCTSCGQEIEEDVKFCPNCGSPQDETKEESNIDEVNGEKVEEENTTSSSSSYTSTTPAGGGKSKIAAGLLGILLGSFGVHNFYLGYTGKAIGQLCLTLIGWILCGLGPVIAGVWGLVEGILILTGSISVDANGNELSD